MIFINLIKPLVKESEPDQPAILKTDIAPSPLKNFIGNQMEPTNLAVFRDSASTSPFKNTTGESRDGPIKVFMSKRDSSQKAGTSSSSNQRRRSSSSKDCLIRLQPTSAASKISSEQSKGSN